MKKLPVILTVLVLSCLGLTASAAQARDLHIGISANSRSGETAEDIGEIQDLVAETGAHWIREDLEWQVVEPSKGTWSWTHYDDLFLEAAERDIQVLPILNSPPCWAVPEEVEECENSYPTSNSDYANFTAKAVERYGPGGDFWEAHPLLDSDVAARYWEIWNEPYFGFTSNGEVDPGRYAALYKAAVIAGRGANPATDYLIESAVDARTGPEPSDFVHWAEALVEAEPTLGSYIDGLAVHPYPGPNDPGYEPENGTDGSFHNTEINYERWREQGVNKPVWITEVGYSACTDSGECVPGATLGEREEQKAEWLSEVFDELGDNDYSFVHGVFLYNLREGGSESEPDFEEDKENWFGILDQGGEKVPAWSAFAAAIEEFDGVPVPNSTITSYSVKGSTAKFGFSVDDETATPECKLDAGAWTACTSPKEYTGVSTGNHEFAVRATNAEGTENNADDLGWGRRAPGTVTDDAGTGTLTWANVGNAKSADNFYSVAEVAKGTTATAHYLKATNFGYSVPGGETIVGIQASIERSEAGSSTGEVKDSRVRIVKAGTIKSTVDRSAGAKWPTVDTVAHFGGEGDTWGEGWTTSDINNSGFGVAVSPQLKGVGGARKAQIDEIELVVFWD